MEKIKDEKLRKILQEIAELLKQVYGDRLKAVILYGLLPEAPRRKIPT